MTLSFALLGCYRKKQDMLDILDMGSNSITYIFVCIQAFYLSTVITQYFRMDCTEELKRMLRNSQGEQFYSRIISLSEDELKSLRFGDLCKLMEKLPSCLSTAKSGIE